VNVTIFWILQGVTWGAGVWGIGPTCTRRLIS